MAEIVNLRTIRKRKAREEAAVLAQENRAKFGQPKAERKLKEANAELARKAIDAHKREE